MNNKLTNLGKSIIGVFKDIGFSLKTEINLKEVDFLEILFNL